MTDSLAQTFNLALRQIQMPGLRAVESRSSFASVASHDARSSPEISSAGYPEHLVTRSGRRWPGGSGPCCSSKYRRPRGAATAAPVRLRHGGLRHLRNAPPLSKVAWDGKLQNIHNALGTRRWRGGAGRRLRTKREIRVANLFREAPENSCG